MAKPTVGSMSAWSGVLKDLFRQIDDGSHTLESIQAFNEHRNPFEVAVSAADKVAVCYSFYRQFFGLDLDFSDLRIPTPKPGFTHLLIVAEGLTPNRVYDVCSQHFPCWRYTNDLDAALDWAKEERDPRKGAYAIWIRDMVEADENLKNISADSIKARGLTTETLTERLLQELVCWHETKKRLDIQNITLCSGSRYQDGFVPSVRWRRHDGEVFVGYYSSGDSRSYLRSRQVVS